MEFYWYLVFVGRPNAGKSSLIRRLTAANPVVGKNPGSTRRINEYRLDKKFKVVDIPAHNVPIVEHSVPIQSAYADITLMWMNLTTWSFAYKFPAVEPHLELIVFDLTVCIPEH